ncbi:exonuclease SbcC [Flavobacterium micromati]|uniref:Exonuclease SbcC n=1 Tax=Flavobacterium micromati TaxID=229205 RepID=A0A1M5MSQ3_9FLAO|nr:AAA family ATPase [Flavobacterium micromati]SHG80404.1 exonuclease SbcC [Flavobacterium micromati]
MLPLKLSITGLYSYQKKQTIDFEELTDAGLFGIFGAVGSGKSSILEAIGFVLYGETDRLHKTDRRAYNMLNLKSDRANIEFDFVNFEERKFKFVADWKRKKRFEETTSIERLAYEWKEETWIPMTSADATLIIGLTYENFRRTIIIPQGKFSEFLSLKGKERSDMMKEIFYLQRFDLAYKVANAQSVTRTELDLLKGALTGFEAISAETISVLENEVSTAESELQKDKAVLILAEAELQKLTTLKKNFEDLEKKKVILAELMVQKPDIDTLQHEIITYEITEKNFKAILQELKLGKTVLDKTKEQLLNVDNNKTALEQNRKNNQIVIDGLQPQFDQLEVSKKRVTDLESIEKVLGLQIDLAAIEKKIANATVFSLESEKKENELKQNLTIIHADLLSLKSKKLDGNILLEVGNWYNLQESKQSQLATKVDRIKIIEEYVVTQKVAFLDLALPLENWKKLLDEKKEVVHNDKTIAFSNKTKLLVSKELAHFTNSLHEGENCPLCGSLEHPNVMVAEDVSEELKNNEATILRLVNQEKEFVLLESKANKIDLAIAHAVEQLQITLAEKAALESEFTLHLSNFIWKNFNAVDKSVFLDTKQQQQLIENKISETEVKENSIRVQQQKTANELKTLSAENAILSSEKAAKTATLTNELSQLKVVDFGDYEKSAIINIQEEKNKLNQQNNRIATEFKLKSDAITLQNIELAGLEGTLNLIQQQLISYQKAVQEIQKTIAILLQTHHFDSVEIVNNILEKTWDIAFEKNRTRQFAIDLKVAENAFAQAEELVLNQIFTSREFEDFINTVAVRKEKFEVQLGIVSKVQDNLKRITAAFAEKAELLQQFEVLNNRFINLGILANMFNASGFVNYVSSIYLQNLSDVANVRFHRMTKNQLSLTINSSNEFEVIDYLNNGASRSVKTLSGGQGFQASLCLALALAESVQSLNKNDKNFFFIDEGFGTQDAESISIVFETLQSLRKENRIVGIISHVAELQERIPRSITIVNEDGKGSKVITNWN